MKNVRSALIFAGFNFVSFPVMADELHPLQAYSLDLGPVSGIVYFETRGTDDRLVATLTNGPDGMPVRMITTLVAGQSATISVPRGVGEPALAVTFERRGDQVFTTESETVVGSIR